jgi:hypothetical protein
VETVEKHYAPLHANDGKCDKSISLGLADLRSQIAIRSESERGLECNLIS